MLRTDLLELTPSVLTALANAGLVKRAQREVEQGRYGEPTVSEDGTVTVSSDDGATATLPPGAGLDGSCTCGAAGICRHRLAAVLRYQAAAGPADVATQDGPARAVTPPGTLPAVDTDALTTLLDKRTLAAAARQRDGGYLATVRVADPDDDQPCAVELGTSTVRFLLGGDLRYARCDCTRRTACEHTALAVWALDAARPHFAEAPDLDQVLVAIGVTATVGERSGDVRQLIGTVLTVGLAHAGPTLALRLAAARRQAEREGHTWIVHLLDRLGQLHAAIERRAASDVRADAADAAAGLVARTRASRPGALPASLVLGTEERGRTQLGQVRLVGLGAATRQGDEPGSCLVELLLVEPTSGTLLVARKDFAARRASNGSDEPRPVDGPAAAFRVLQRDVPVGVVATGSVVTNAAVRRPDRLVEFRTGGLRRTSVGTGGTGIDRFEAAGLVTEPSQIIATWSARPPRLLRPPLVTEDVVVVPLAGGGQAFYDPAEQQVALVADTPSGEAVTVVTTYRDVAPGAPAALARFAQHATGGFVVGRASVVDGNVTITPTLLVGEVVVAPDLAPLDEGARAALAALPLGRTRTAAGTPMDDALGAAWSILGDIVVDGAGGSSRWTDQARHVADRLRAVGLSRVAARVDALIVAVAEQRWQPDPLELADAWADAAIATALGRER